MDVYYTSSLDSAFWANKKKDNLIQWALFQIVDLKRVKIEDLEVSVPMWKS